MEGEHKCALVTGSNGIQGRALLKKLEPLKDWDIIAISRGPLIEVRSRAHIISLDLSDKQAVIDKLKQEKVSRVTHVFHLAFGGDMTNTSRDVAQYLMHVVEGLEATGSSLQHVYFSNGTKYYGVHLGPAKTPFREDDPRHLGPNYYYDQEDWVIRRRSEGASWTWSSFRPGAIIGFSLGYMNLLNDIAIYGTICRELGLAFRFPSLPGAYNALTECIDVDMMAEGQIWLATHPHAQNEAYNINNGDTFRWFELWPKLAAWFGLEVGPPLKIPLATYMPHHKGTWAGVVKKYGLKEYPYEKLGQFEFADATFSATYDNFSDTVKLRKAGFEGQKLWTEEVFMRHLNELADAKIIPAYPTMKKAVTK